MWPDFSGMRSSRYMGKNAKQQYRVTVAELESLAPAMSPSEADHAFSRCRTIAKSGGRPVIYFSNHHGFLVLDLSDEEDRRLNLQIEPHTLPLSQRATNRSFDP
jgi:hypothetical protein